MQAGALEYLITVNNKGVSSGLKQSEKDIKNFGNKLSAWTVAKGQLIAKYAEKAISTVYNISKQTVKGAVDAYGTFEQLEGGIKKLFGEKTQKAVIQNAKNAFRTAGLSANEYMQTVTAFSASLLNSLGGDTDKAAKIADMAIKDMADNVNTFGTSMESVQNAYRGFAKGQFNMLDNLSLGYGGTRKEMERLLKDAGKIANKKFSIGNLSDIYEAINIIQDKKLKITGTTEKEAQDTIQGSIASAKAAWQNVLVEAGKGNWNFKYYVKSFTNVAKNVFKNIKPIATNAIKGLFTIGKELLPEIGGILKDVFKTAKVSLAEILGLGDDATWGQIVSGIGEKLRKGAGKIKVGIATFLDIENPGETSWSQIAGKILTNISNEFGEGGLLGELLSEGTAIIGEVASFASELVTGIADWLAKPESQEAIAKALENIVNSFAIAAPKIIESITTLLKSESFKSALGNIFKTIIDLIKGPGANLVNEVGKEVDKSAGLKEGTTATVADITTGTYLGYKGYQKAKVLLNGGKDTITGIKNLVSQWFPKASEAPVDTSAVMQSLTDNVDDLAAHVASEFSDDAVNTIAQGATDASDDIINAGNQFSQTVTQAGTEVSKSPGWWQGVKDWFKNAKDAISNKAIEIGTSFNPAAFFNSSAMTYGFFNETDIGRRISNTISEGINTLFTGKEFDKTYTVLDYIPEKIEEIKKNASTFFDDWGKLIPGLKTMLSPWRKDQKDTVVVNVQTNINVARSGDAASSTNVVVGTGGSWTQNGSSVNMPNVGSGAQSLTKMRPMINAKGNWRVPFDNYPTLLHRDELVMNKSQARRYRDGDDMDTGAIVSAIQGLRNDMANLKLVVGRKTFGRAVADYGSGRVGDYIGGAESRLAAGYGT